MTENQLQDAFEHELASLFPGHSLDELDAGVVSVAKDMFYTGAQKYAHSQQAQGEAGLEGKGESDRQFMNEAMGEMTADEVISRLRQPPAPAAVPDVDDSEIPSEFDVYMARGYRTGYRACRAKVLASSPSPAEPESEGGA